MRLGKYLKATLTVGDFLILNLSYILTLLIVGDGAGVFASKWVWLIANISFVPSVVFFSAIHNNRIIYADRVVLNGFKSIVLTGLVMAGLLYIFDIFDVRVRILALFFFIFLMLLSLWWVASRFMLKRMRRLGFNFKRAIIIGSGKTARQVFDELRSDAGYGFKVFGVFDNRQHGYSFPGTEVYPMQDVENFIKDNKIDLIYYTLSAEDSHSIVKVMSIAEENGAEFVYVPQFHKVLRGQFQVTTVGNMPSMTFSSSPLHKTVNKMVKRGFDLLFSSVFLLFSPLVFIPIAIGIKLTSPGPIFFRQKRTGIRGSEFVCYKFRTMKVNADSDKLQATENDSRKTRFGDFLRRSSLDELPQFINVFLGNMSVVGPRPHMVLHTEQYSALIEKYMVRHAVKPGITGWAQVNGYRGGTKHLWQMEKRVEYDVWYIRNWNMFLDLKIIFLTMFNGLRGDKNAY